ncbi:regulatory protein RecX [Novosphingobium colocasiae]|uniref:regulatory protein RecX n=1 Tax=Novosphingobium colocasiae TaxID=1256513 RepID=UPI0035AF7834
MSDKRRNRVPFTPAALEQTALAYVARYATTQARLRSYLVRKLRERGWEGTDDRTEDRPEERIEALVMRFAGAGYLDDEAWARMRSGALARRGFGAGRIGQALREAGIAEDLRTDNRLDEPAQRQAALVLARRRRFGPFGGADLLPDRPQREKQVAAMVRAGHPLDIARRIVDARDPEEVEQWVDSA